LLAAVLALRRVLAVVRCAVRNEPRSEPEPGGARPYRVAPGGSHLAAGAGLPLDAGAVAPQALEPVEGALLGVEHVHDERAVVEQHPLERVEPLDAQRTRPARLGDAALDLLDDRLDLP